MREKFLQICRFRCLPLIRQLPPSTAPSLQQTTSYFPTPLLPPTILLTHLPLPTATSHLLTCSYWHIRLQGISLRVKLRHQSKFCDFYNFVGMGMRGVLERRRSMGASAPMMSKQILCYLQVSRDRKYVLYGETEKGLGARKLARYWL